MFPGLWAILSCFHPHFKSNPDPEEEGDMGILWCYGVDVFLMW